MLTSAEIVGLVKGGLRVESRDEQTREVVYLSLLLLIGTRGPCDSGAFYLSSLLGGTLAASLSGLALTSRFHFPTRPLVETLSCTAGRSPDGKRFLSRCLARLFLARPVYFSRQGDATLLSLCPVIHGTHARTNTHISHCPTVASCHSADRLRLCASPPFGSLLCFRLKRP